MIRTLTWLSTACLALFATACGGLDDDHGTYQGATVIGTLESGLHAERPDVRVIVGDFEQEVAVADEEFVAAGLFGGDMTIRVETDDLSGEITIRDTQPGEIIEVSVREDRGGIVIRVERRIHRDPHDHHHHDDDIVLSADDLKYDMPAGVHDGDLIITGDDVKVKGHKCATIINGDLIIEGSHVEVKYLLVRGRVIVADGTHDVKIKAPKHCHHGHHHHHHGHDHDDDWHHHWDD